MAPYKQLAAKGATRPTFCLTYLFNFSKAFDRVLHKSLLKRLCFHGVRGKVTVRDQERARKREGINQFSSCWRREQTLNSYSVLVPVPFATFLLNNLHHGIENLENLGKNCASIFNILSHDVC